MFDRVCQVWFWFVCHFDASGHVISSTHLCPRNLRQSFVPQLGVLNTHTRTQRQGGWMCCHHARTLPHEEQQPVAIHLTVGRHGAEVRAHPLQEVVFVRRTGHGLVTFPHQHARSPLLEPYCRVARNLQTKCTQRSKFSNSPRRQ